MSDEANQSPHADAGRGLSEELGLLPQPAMLRGVDEDYYTAEQMRAYGAQERAAERERCAAIAWELGGNKRDKLVEAITGRPLAEWLDYSRA
jgi:hypothetical protein